MIAVSSVHQPLFNLPQQSQSTQAQAAEDVSNKPPPTPASEHAGKRINGVVDGQESQNSRQQTGQTAAETKDSHESNFSKPSPDHKLKLLNEADRQQVEKLSQRDREVRTHEAAHLAAAGQHATSGAKYTYSRGPDGRSYAVGGSVDIDTSAEVDPEATIRKADQIRRAALAPAEPSSQDRAVAAQATSLRVQAQSDLVKLQAEEKRAVNQSEAASEPESTPELRDSSPRVSPDTDDVNRQSEQTDRAMSAIEQDSNLSEGSPSGCAVCGGKHGSEDHIAANQNKVNTNYLGQSEQAASVPGKIDFVV